MKNINDHIPVEETFEPFLNAKAKGKDNSGGNYRRNVGRELQQFLRWLEGDLEEYSGVVPDNEDRKPLMSDLSKKVFRQYARHLNNNRGLKSNTIQTYYQYISSWCGWCKRENYLQIHYATKSTAKAPIPEDDGRRPGDQQAWTPQQRNQIVIFVNKKAYESLSEYRDLDFDDDSPVVDQHRHQAIKDSRDRTFVNIIAYTGVRIGELLRVPADSRRKGLLWDDVNLDDGTILVYRKKQQWDSIALTDDVLETLKIYRNVIQPPSEQWPVFPTFGNEKLSQVVRTELENRGKSETEINAIQDNYKYDLFVCLDKNIIPPSISPDSGRRILKQLSNEAGIEIDDSKHEYLSPHGGRRGLGEILVREKGYTLAARYLDNSEEMVRKRYSHVVPGNIREDVTAAIESDKKFSGENSGSRDSDG